MKPTILFIAGLVLTSGATGIQPAEVDNVTARVELNASEVFRSGLQTTPGEYAPSNYPYLSSNKPEALVPYGDTKELTNIYMPDGLIAYYPLDETTGNTANDITTTLPKNNGRHQGLIEQSLGVRGNVSRAYNFSSSEGYVGGMELNSVVDGAITVSAWVKPRQLSGSSYQGFVTEKYSPNNNDVVFELFAESGTRYGAGFYDGSWHKVYTDTAEAGEWSHVVGTYDGNRLAIYKNGDSKSTISDSSGLPDGDLSWEIGRRHDNYNNPQNYWDGRIDDVRIYNRSLSQKEVQRLYNYQQKDQPGTEQISATITSGGFILANTKGGTPSIESQNQTVNTRTLLGQVSPSFGFPQPKNPSTTQIVYRSPYNLTGDSFSTTSSGIELRSIPEIGDNATVSVTPAD